MAMNHNVAPDSGVIYKQHSKTQAEHLALHRIPIIGGFPQWWASKFEPHLADPTSPQYSHSGVQEECTRFIHTYDKIRSHNIDSTTKRYLSCT
jgi:hypothetical protein